MNEAWDILNDLLKTKNFQLFQDYLAISTGLAIITVDYKGTPITTHSGCNRFCSMMRAIPEYAEKCEKCDSYGGVEAARLKTSFVYLCHANIVDLAVPIILDGIYLGAVMAGQVRLENEDQNEKIEPVYRLSDLERIFHDSEAIRDAYQNLPQITFSKVEAASKIIETLCKYIVSKPDEQLIKEFITINNEKHLREYIGGKSKIELLQKALEYIEHNYDKDCNVKKLSKMCNISESYFSKLFLKQMGKTLTQYVSEIRIIKAKQYLIKTRYSVGYIAEHCGFEDTSYFIKVFKRVTGATPNRFRQMIENGQEMEVRR